MSPDTIGVAHPDFSEDVVAMVAREADSVLNPAEISRALATELTAFKRPKRVVIVDKPPRNTMGKVQKVELRALHKDSFNAASV